MISKLEIIELSDLHLGHRTTPTAHIVESLNLLIPPHADLSHIDLIIIAGDMFDRLLEVPTYEFQLILSWMYQLLHICVRNDIVLRVLEGTPSHDNLQPRLIVDINAESKIGCDLQYVSTLHIEYIERFDITILYIPDEYHPDCNITLKEVRELMTSKGLTQVDMAVMHGAFDYQLKTHLLNRIPHHDSSAYLKLVKYLIFIGHIHQHSQYDRILSAGSTDRLHHNEEEDKGMIRVTLYNNGQFDATFVVNKNAMLYKTINLEGLNIEEGLRKLKSVLETLPSGSRIRIKAGADNQLVSAIKTLSYNYPEYHWKTLVDKDTRGEHAVTLSKPEVGMDNLHANTIPTLMDERLKLLDVAEDLRVESVKLLEEIINEHTNNTPSTT